MSSTPSAQSPMLTGPPPRTSLDLLCRIIAACPVQQSVVHAVDELRRNVCTALQASAAGQAHSPFTGEGRVIHALQEALGAAQRVGCAEGEEEDAPAAASDPAAGLRPSTPVEDAADTITSAANTLRVIHALDKVSRLLAEARSHSRAASTLIPTPNRRASSCAESTSWMSAWSGFERGFAFVGPSQVRPSPQSLPPRTPHALADTSATASLQRVARGRRSGGC